jgi:FdhD protein
MTLPFYVEIDVTAVRAGSRRSERLAVCAEYPVAIGVNGAHIATIACSGADLRELCTGFFVSEGLIKSPDDIESFTFDEDTLAVDVRLAGGVDPGDRFSAARIVTGGGRARKGAPDIAFTRAVLPRIRADVVRRVIGEFLRFSTLHDLTHGVHSAALYSLDGERLIFFDEIGRHNAIDKVIGRALMRSVSLENTMLFSTGRISSEIACKVITSGAPVFISRASPTDYAAELLRRFNVLTLCRAREDGFLVINGEDHID